MDGIYPKILGQAYRLTKSNRSFWTAGLFLVWPNLFRAFVIIALAVEYGPFNVAPMQQDTSAVNNSPWFGLASLLVIGLLYIYYFRAKVVLFLSVKHLQTEKALDKSKLKRESDPLVARILNFSVLAITVLGLLVTFLYSPVLYLDTSGFVGRSVVLGTLATLVLLPTGGLIYSSMVFGPMFMAAHGLSSADAARASSDMFRRNWLFIAVLWLILFAIELAGVAVSVLGLVVATIPFVLLNQIFYDGGALGMQPTLLALAGIAGFMVFFMSQAMVTAFQRVAWAVAFFEIVRPVKIEEEAPETLPEVIS
jgi:hypothetical protein